MVIRFFDVLLGLAALITLIPGFLLIATILRLTGEGKVFYLQSRIGAKGKPFRIIKFATMLQDSPNMATGTITVLDDFRVLPLGKVLRKTKINELPQLVNVILGDMSLVGPRPLVAESYQKYSEKSKAAISSVRPGISGIGSIFFRNEEEILAKVADPVIFYEEHILPYKEKLEEWYSKNLTLWSYFEIIGLTIVIVLCPHFKVNWDRFDNMPKPDQKLLNVIREL